MAHRQRTAAGLTTSPQEGCRAFYAGLRQETRRDGLSAPAIEHARTELSEVRDGICWLRPQAYSPTGVALGVPLPGQDITRALRSITDSLTRYLTADQPPLALVPPDSYHMTLVNRAHYLVGGRIRPLSIAQHRQVAAIVRRSGIASIEVDLRGLLLTNYGALIVAGYPRGPELYDLRRRIAESIPALRVHLPLAAHVKIAQLLINPADLPDLLSQISDLGKTLRGRLTFHDLYTPAGRICLAACDARSSAC